MPLDIDLDGGWVTREHRLNEAVVAFRRDPPTDNRSAGRCASGRSDASVISILIVDSDGRSNVGEGDVKTDNIIEPVLLDIRDELVKDMPLRFERDDNAVGTYRLTGQERKAFCFARIGTGAFPGLRLPTTSATAPYHRKRGHRLVLSKPSANNSRPYRPLTQ